MPADLLLYIIIAAGLIFWLRSMLGTTDDEDDKIREKKSKDMEEKFLAMTGQPSKEDQRQNKLSQLSGQRGDLPRHVRFDNKTAENNLEDIALNQEEFSLSEFLQGAEYAYSMIVEAFASGDLDTLEDLLTPSVFKAFEGVIKDREKRGEHIDTTVKNIERMDITEAYILDGVFYIALRIAANEICIIRDKAGDIISGDPNKVTQVVDIWVFGKEVKSDGPEWYLYETRDEEEEDHKTPIPDAK